MTMTETTSPRIYVASLSDYNAGRLHGRWIDATQDPDDIADQVQEMLAASPEAVAFPEGGFAEEWAIHDYEGFGGIRLSEWESFETVAKLAEMIDEHDGAFIAWYENESRNPVDDWAEEFSDEYAGEWDDMEAFAYELAEDMGVEVPNTWPLSYVDWAAAARDLILGGDYWTAPAPGGIYVFRSA